MKIKYILILILATATTSLWSQTLLPDDVEDYHDPSILKSVLIGNQYIPNGKAFTPKGDLRALIICAGFGAPYDNQTCQNWATGSNTLPDWANDPNYIYDDYFDFTTYASANHYQNFSRFYYEMSNHTFRFISDVYPNRINIDPLLVSNWDAANREVLRVMKIQNPNFDWSPYDNRENPPEYLFDNSNTASDSVIDFIIIVYRYNKAWSNQPIPFYANGFASNSINNTFSYNGYYFDSQCGYTHMTGGESFYNLFIHEVAHNIFECPHYAMANSIVGNYFYGQFGWGMMKLSYVLNSALGWERWLLGWIDIKANGVNSAVNSSNNLPVNGEFILRDHITTGDVIRIKLNNGYGDNQYLWIENHQGLSIFDERTMRTDGCGNAMPTPPRGMLAYIESIKDEKTVPIDFWYDIKTRNGIKFIHPSGNYDYSVSNTASLGCLWGNYLYSYTENAANPISGQNRATAMRWDMNNDNTIYFRNGANQNQGNEQDWVAKRNNIETKDFMGTGLAFPTGQKLGMDSNPCLTSRPKFESTNNLEYAYLNGISVTKIADLSSNRIKIKVEFNDCDIDNNVRWTGNIALNNVTNNSNPDVLLKTGHTITINKSGTPNRTTKIDGEFINYTNFRSENGSYFKMEANSTVILDENSTFTLQSGSTLEIENGAEFIVKNNSKLVVENGANIIIKGNGAITLKCNGKLCASTGASINLQDVSSSIHFLGTGGLSPGCLSNLSGVLTGSGSIRNYTSATSVNNATINSDTYFSGSTITSTNVSVQGTGTDLIYSITDEATINGPFDVPVGATFEVKLNSTNCSN